MDLNQQDPAGKYNFLLEAEFSNALQNGLSGTKDYTRYWDARAHGPTAYRALIRPTACFYMACVKYGFDIFSYDCKKFLTKYFVTCDIIDI